MSYVEPLDAFSSVWNAVWISVLVFLVGYMAFPALKTLILSMAYRAAGRSECTNLVKLEFVERYVKISPPTGRS